MILFNIGLAICSFETQVAKFNLSIKSNLVSIDKNNSITQLTLTKVKGTLKLTKKILSFKLLTLRTQKPLVD